MAKLYSYKEEVRALKSMCEASTKLKAKLISRLDVEHFYSTAGKEAAARIKALIRKEGEIPSWSEICVDPVISEVSRTTLSKSKEEIYQNEKEAIRGFRILTKYYKMRKLYFMSEKLNEKLLKENLDVDELMDFASTEINKARVQPSENVPIYHLGKGSNSSAIFRKILSNEKPDLVPTGFRAFDRINGGFMYGSLVLLGGSTGGGKSTMGIQMLKNMATYAESVAYVPLEMTEEESFMRLSANLARIPLTKIVNKNLTKNEKKKIWSSVKEYDAKVKKSGCRYTVFSPEIDMTVDEILITLKPYGHRVVLIDYISLLKGVDGEDAWQQLGKVARFCKIYAKNNNMIIILLVQVNDDGQIRYSKAVVEHANNAFFWVTTDESRENGIIQIKQKKARNQQMFDFQLKFQPEFMSFTDIDEDDEPLEKSSDEDVTNKNSDSYLEDIGSSSKDEDIEEEEDESEDDEDNDE